MFPQETFSFVSFLKTGSTPVGGTGKGLPQRHSRWHYRTINDSFITSWSPIMFQIVHNTRNMLILITNKLNNLR